MANETNAIMFPLYKNKSGYHGLEIDAKAFAQFQAVFASMEEGAKAVIFNRKKAKEKDTDPDAYLKFLTKEEVAEGKAKYAAAKGSRGGL